MAEKKVQITVIGGGLAGSITVAELLKNFPVPANITLIEQDPGRVGGGIAYGASTAESFHQTNAPARRMIEAATGNAEEMVPALGLEPHKVIPRHKVREVMLSEMYNAASQSPTQSRLDILQGSVTDVTETKNGKKVRISFDSGNHLETDILVLATGNIDQRELPAVKAVANDNVIMERCIENQWLPEGKKKIANIDLESEVLIVGTALSGYDAVRSLLNRGHKGKITMMSRHGLEHPALPENIPMPPTFTLPRPRFMDLLDDPAEALKEMVAEYEELTGLAVDLKKGSINTENWRATANINPGKNYLPHHVLLVWEKHMPEIIEKIGVGKMHRILKENSALIMTLTTGVSNIISNEIETAKKAGQLSVVSAEISKLARGNDGIKVHFHDKASGRHKVQTFSAMIVSLGTNTDFSQTKSDLWNGIMEKGYTSPHPIGVGVCIDGKKGFGALPGSDIIYTVGIPAAGERMATEGSLGSSACSAVAMREGAVRTAASIVDSFNKKMAQKKTARKPKNPGGLSQK